MDEIKDPKRVIEAGPANGSQDHMAVDKMVEFMKHELDANMVKKGGRKNWMTARPLDHLLQTYYHTGKLQVALKTLLDLKENPEATRSAITHYEGEVREYAADVANHAMMLLDVLDLLGMPAVEKPPDLKPKKKKKKVHHNYDSYS